MTQCEIIQDLLPLYHDGACSQASRALVEEHVAGCAACRAELEALEAPLPAMQPPQELERGRGLRTARRKLMRKTALAVAAVLCAMAIFTVGGAALYVAFEKERLVPMPESGQLLSAVSFTDDQDGTYSDILLDFSEKRYLSVSCLFRRVEMDGEARDIAILQMTQSWSRKLLDTYVGGPYKVPLGAGTQLYIARGAQRHDVAYGKEYEPEYWNTRWEYKGDVTAVYYLDHTINSPLHLVNMPEKELADFISQYGALLWKDGEML